MSKRKVAEYEDDWSEYKKYDARKDHKHREERKSKEKAKHTLPE